MKLRHLVTSLTLTSCLGLGACSGGNYSRINEKQSTTSDIKISQFDLANLSIDLRFEYRTYIKKSLKEIDCDIDFNSGDSLVSLKKTINIELDPFSTEVLEFKNIGIDDADSLLNLDTINYFLNCELNYNKGKEGVFERSVLHLVPGTNDSYR